MFILQYDPRYGTPIADGMIEEVYQKALISYRETPGICTLHTSSNYMSIMRLQIAILTDEIPHNDITIQAVDAETREITEYHIDKYGRLSSNGGSTITDYREKLERHIHILTQFKHFNT